MEISSLEKQVNDILLKIDSQGLYCLYQKDQRVWQVLQSNLYNSNEILRWRSVEAIASLLHRQWDLGQREKVQDYLRRLMWSISDESGGIGWTSPQTIAEITVAIPQLRDPFVNNMICRALSEPALISGGLWGIGRLGQSIRPSIYLFKDILLASFGANDAEIVGLAAWAAGEIRLNAALPYLQSLLQRPETVQIYIPHDIIGKPLGTWAREARDKIAKISY